MFCPDGFQTLADTYRLVGDIALQWSRKQPRIEGRKLTQDMTEPEAARWEAYREWLWGRFVNRTAGQLFVTSPEGHALILDNQEFYSKWLFRRKMPLEYRRTTCPNLCHTSCHTRAFGLSILVRSNAGVAELRRKRPREKLLF